MSIIPQHVLISRVDNIGDVVLTLGVAACLKQHFPQVKITFLARDYVRDVIAQSPAVDVFMSADAWLALPDAAAVTQLRQLQVDTFIHAFPRRRIASLARKAGIKHRIGTARRWYHLLTCNHRPNFSRAKANLHEAQLNLRLLEPLGITSLPDLTTLASWLALKRPVTATSAHLHPNKFNLILHPFSNGHTREWPLSYFSELVSQLPPDRFHVLVTGSAAERTKLQPLLQQHAHLVDLSGQLTLHELMALIAKADGLVANATGPMHLAAALGVPTLGLFPLQPVISPQRWQPLGLRAEFLTADTLKCPPAPCTNDDCRCIRAISVTTVRHRIETWAANHD